VFDLSQKWRAELISRTTIRRTGAVLTLGASIGLTGLLAVVPAATGATAPTGDEAALNWVVNSTPGAPAAEAIASAIVDAGGKTLISYPEIGVTVARAPDDGFRARLQEVDGVESVGPTRTSTAPDRLAAPAASAAGVTEEPASMPAEGTAWNTVAIGATARTGEGVVVGIADSGIDAGHPDLADRIDPALSVGCGVDGVPDTRPEAWQPSANPGGLHGTHVAGSVAGAANGSGIRGIAPGARVASIKVDNQTGHIYPEASICATMWAVRHEIPIMNHSYYVDPWYVWCADVDTQSAALESLRRAYAYAYDHGVLTVAAVGNEGQDLTSLESDVMSPNDGARAPRAVDSSCLGAPAGLPDVVSVAGADQDEATGSLVRAGFSNFGAGKVTVTAPGVVWSAVPRQDDGAIYASLPGTSMASPHVAGLAAALLSEDPSLTPDELTQRITRAADPLGGVGEEMVGAGLIDAGSPDSPAAVGVYSRIAFTGQPFAVSGSGYAPDTAVELRIGDATERVVADASGRFATVFPIPDDAVVGESILDAGSATAPITIRESAAAPTVLTPRPAKTVYATSTSITGTGVPGSFVRVIVTNGEHTSFFRFVRVGEDGRWAATAPLASGDYEVSARTIVGDATSAITEPIPFSVHTKPAITYSAQLAPRPGMPDDTLVILDLTNAGATTGTGVVDIDLTGYDRFETPTPAIGTIERTEHGLRWHLTLDAAQKTQLPIVAHDGDEPSFPIIRVEQ
jgi:subtilisin family serine protease